MEIGVNNKFVGLGWVLVSLWKIIVSSGIPLYPVVSMFCCSIIVVGLGYILCIFELFRIGKVDIVGSANMETVVEFEVKDSLDK